MKKAFASISHKLDVSAGAPKRVLLFKNGKNKRLESGAEYFLKSAASVISNSKPNSIDLMIDYDHVTDLNTLPGKGGVSPAAGWISSFEHDEVGLWGNVDWVENGEKAITSREYRYLSPVFKHDKDGTILQVLRASLTNTPALELIALASQSTTEDETMEFEKMWNALCKALGLDEGADQKTVLASVQKIQEQKDKNGVAVVLASVSTALGLNEEAKQETLVSACSAMVAEVSDLKTKLTDRDTAIMEMQKAIQAGDQKFALASVEKKVDDAISTGKLIPAQRDWAISICSQDTEKFEELVKVTPVINLSPSNADGQPPASKQGELTAAEKTICSQTGVNEADFLETRKGEQV